MTFIASMPPPVLRATRASHRRVLPRSRAREPHMQTSSNIVIGESRWRNKSHNRKNNSPRVPALDEGILTEVGHVVRIGYRMIVALLRGPTSRLPVGCPAGCPECNRSPRTRPGGNSTGDERSRQRPSTAGDRRSRNSRRTATPPSQS